MKAPPDEWFSAAVYTWTCTSAGQFLGERAVEGQVEVQVKVQVTV